MKREDIREILVDIMKDILDDDKIEINEDTTKEGLEDWDSVVHMTLIATLEEEFRIQFELNEIVYMNSIERMVECIEKRCK